MVHSAKEFMREAVPVAKLLRSINDSFYRAYEFDKHDYAEGGIAADDGEGAPREKWGLDLSKKSTPRGKWGDSLIDVQNHVLYHVVSNAIRHEQELDNFFEDVRPVSQIQQVRDNLSNAWRDEFALNDPISGSAADRMRTTEWRISMAYYAIFKSHSALMRTQFDEITDGSPHSGMWMKHRSEFMEVLGNKLYVFPFMFFPRDCGPHSSKWFDWTVPYPIQDEFYEDQQDTLQSIAKNSLSTIHSQASEITWEDNQHIITFYDLLLVLRHWANYQNGGIFSRLYGEGYIKSIDEALRLITFTGMTIAEVGIIMARGLDVVEFEYNWYRQSCEEGVSDALHLIERRMSVYQQAFDS